MRIALMLGLFATSGCVAVWGSSYHIEHADDIGVVIRYDPALASSSKMRAAANTACSRYLKVAVPKEQSRDNPYVIGTVMFACETPSAAAADPGLPLHDMVLIFNPAPIQQPAPFQLPSPNPAVFAAPTPPAPAAPRPLPNVYAPPAPQTWGETPYAPMIPPVMRDQPVTDVNPMIPSAAR